MLMYTEVQYALTLVYTKVHQCTLMYVCTQIHLSYIVHTDVHQCTLINTGVHC